MVSAPPASKSVASGRRPHGSRATLATPHVTYHGQNQPLATTAYHKSAHPHALSIPISVVARRSSRSQSSTKSASAASLRPLSTRARADEADRWSTLWARARSGQETDSSSELSSCCAGGEKSSAPSVRGPAQ